MNHQIRERYRTILQQYRLHPEYIEDYGKVKKIFTPSGVFALKEFSALEQWNSIENVHRLFYGKVVPIYPTSSGNFFVTYRNRYYYLMPWVVEQGEKRNEKYLKMFRDLAHIHQKSIKEIKVNEEAITNSYEHMKKQKEERRDFLQSYVEACENEWYMSPFQLRFCTFFHETMQAYWFSSTQLEKWYEKIKETKNWRVAVVHGSPSLSHYVQDGKGNGYFLSLERSHIAPPLSDVIQFFQRYLRIYPVQCDECISWMVEYENMFPIRDEEKALFQSYLSEPLMIYQIVDDYVNTRKKRNEREFVIRLQKAYWMMKNIEYLIGRLGEIEENKRLQEESHASNQ